MFACREAERRAALPFAAVRKSTARSSRPRTGTPRSHIRSATSRSCMPCACCCWSPTPDGATAPGASAGRCTGGAMRGPRRSRCTRTARASRSPRRTTSCRSSTSSTSPPSVSERLVVALGGNAIAGERGADPESQRIAVEGACEQIAELVGHGHDVVITHGNGPQVGNLLLKNDLARDVVPPVPLDWCVAQTQATLGFLIVTALEEALRRRGLERLIGTVITRVLVSAGDPAFAAPSKPIGRYVTADDAAERIAAGEAWEDRGERGWRRVVASPDPLEIL